MADVEEIIDYIKSLKKGFDKELFQSKIDELAYIVDTTGLDYDDFHTLFKVWLNLSIPMTKWISLGACLVPQDIVEQRTVEYSFRWILANYGNCSNFSKLGFLLDWLTAAMDCECISMSALDGGYELFYAMVTFEALTIHAVKLVYVLTKPADVTRRKVLELLAYIKTREGKKNLCRQLQVLLGLFKSYKPECVPEDIPAISIHTAFKKINEKLLARFKTNQEHRNSYSREKQHLWWINPNLERGRNKNVEPLLPNMEFVQLGSKQYADRGTQKTYIDFADPVCLLQYSLQHRMMRPARLRALLCNATGHTLLAIGSAEDHAFLSHDLQHLLTSCFLDGSPHSYLEKQEFLQQLVILQRIMLRGLPVVTRFLAQYLLLWNEKDYFAEILDLVEWVSVDSPEQVSCIVSSLAKVYHRAQPMEQCAILYTLANMYSNMVLLRTRTQQNFMNLRPVEENYGLVLSNVAVNIADLCSKALQVNPDDIRVLYTMASASERIALSELRCRAPLGALPHRLSLSLALVAPSPALLDKMAALMELYKQALTIMKSTKNIPNHQVYVEQIQTLKRYCVDLIGCLYSEQALSNRDAGLVFVKLHPQLVAKLTSLIPDLDSSLSLRNNIAFAPHTYIQCQEINNEQVDNKLWFHNVIDQEYKNLSRFLSSAVSDLRCK